MRLLNPKKEKKFSPAKYLFFVGFPVGPLLRWPSAVPLSNRSINFFLTFQIPVCSLWNSLSNFSCLFWLWEKKVFTKTGWGQSEHTKAQEIITFLARTKEVLGQSFSTEISIRRFYAQNLITIGSYFRELSCKRPDTLTDSRVYSLFEYTKISFIINSSTFMRFLNKSVNLK